MVSKALEDALNEQVAAEFYSAYFYLSMSAYCESNNLSGAAHWFRVQFEEEQLHALKLFDLVCAMGGRVNLKQIDTPPSDFESILDVFQQTLAHEQKVSVLINDLYALSIKENNYAAQSALQWFVTEQLEEERTAEDIVHQLVMVVDNPTGLLFVDSKLGSRAPAQPPDPAGA